MMEDAAASPMNADDLRKVEMIIKAIERQKTSHWQVDKRIPLVGLLAFALAVVIQTGGFVWWASQIENRVSVLEAARSGISENSSRIRGTERSLAVLESKVDTATGMLLRIDDKLDRVAEDQGN